MDFSDAILGGLSVAFICWLCWIGWAISQGREENAFMRETDKWKEERDREQARLDALVEFQSNQSWFAPRTEFEARGISDSSYLAATQQQAMSRLGAWHQTQVTHFDLGRIEIAGAKARKCSGCGATAKGKCEYCGGEA